MKQRGGRSAPQRQYIYSITNGIRCDWSLSAACCIMYLFRKNRITDGTIRKNHRCIFHHFLRNLREVSHAVCKRRSEWTRVRLKTWHLNCKSEMHACSYGYVRRQRERMKKQRSIHPLMVASKDEEKLLYECWARLYKMHSVFKTERL